MNFSNKNLILLFLILFIPPLSGQVSVGVGEAPVIGALLQLKEDNEIGVNSTKGLGLPRVKLTSLWNLYPMFAEADGITPTAEYLADKGGGGVIDQTHIGLLVFNTETQAVVNSRLCPGLHVWNGTVWTPLKRYPDFSAISTSLAGPEAVLTDIRGSEINVYHTARFHSAVPISGNPYSCDPKEEVLYELIDAGIWMTENMNTKFAPNNANTPIGLAGTNGMGFREASYFYPNGVKGQASPPSSWDKREGLLYNWAAATVVADGVTGQGGTVDGKGNISNDSSYDEAGEVYSVRQGICPQGWHLPSDAEWAQLQKVMEADPNQYTVAGANISQNQPSFLLLEEGLDNNNLDTKGRSLPSDQGGFASLLPGYSVGGDKQSYNLNAYYWSSSSSGGGFSWGRFLYSRYPAVDRLREDRNDLYSVRCKKD